MQYLQKQTEWMQLLQEEKTGGVYGGILIDTKETIPTYKMEELSLEASACFAAALAKFSYVYQSYNPEYAAQCLKAADRAWEYINKQQKDITDELSPMLYCAATELYRASGQGSYRLAAKRFLETSVKTGESFWDTCGSVTYLSTRHTVNVEYCNTIMKDLMTCAEKISVGARSQVYLTDGKADFSNTKELLWNMVILSVADYVITNHEYATVIENHQHFFAGCNPTGVCLVQEEGCDSFWDGGEGIQQNLLMNAYYICMLSQILNREE